ncbi:MAG: MucR family transcriptional regulator [Mycobacterium gordonae]|nr:MucR family transcriptional regulator [Mycobacterium gordonae]
MRVGDRDGHGFYGQLSVAADGRLVCHECGRAYLHLGTHAQRAHGLSSAQYRAAHGLELTAVLLASGVRQKMSQAWERHRDEHIANLDRSRNPDRARAQMRPRSQWPAATRVRRAAALSAKRGRSLTDAEMRQLGDDLPLQQWCEQVRALLAGDPTITALSISRSFDRSESWIYQRLRRYPPNGD